MIRRSVFFVDLVGRRIDGVEGVHPDAPLEAASRFLAEEPLHFHLFDEILRRLVKMGEPVDRMAGQIGRRRHEILVFRILRQRVRHRDTVD